MTRLSLSPESHALQDAHGGPDHLGIPLHDFSTNSNACGPCPAALTAVLAADATRYPDPAYVAVRNALGLLHSVDAERIVIAASASEFIFRITAAVAQHGDAIVSLPIHSYGDYAAAARAWRLPVQREVRVDVHSATQLIWRCDPASPTGQADDRLGAVIDALSPRAVCVLDLAYEPLRLSGTLTLDRRQLDRVWQLWTPNKALGLTGVRAAYAIAPLNSQELLAAVRRLAPSWPTGSHGAAMLKSWAGRGAQQWISNSLSTLREWKATQLDLCHAMDWQCLPSTANFFCARPPVDAVETLCRTLRVAGIKLRDTASFDMPRHVRLGVLTPQAQWALHDAWRKSGFPSRDVSGASAASLP